VYLSAALARHPDAGNGMVIIAGGFCSSRSRGPCRFLPGLSGIRLVLPRLVSLVRPLRFIYIRTPPIGVDRCRPRIALALGTLLLLIKTRRRRLGSQNSTIGCHTGRWRAPYAPGSSVAGQSLCRDSRRAADEILLFRTLTAIRRGGGTGPESIMNAPEQSHSSTSRPTRSFCWRKKRARAGLRHRHRVPGSAQIRALEPDLFRKTLRPGVVLGYELQRDPAGNGGSMLSTETRIYANSRSILRQFGIYWRLIHPGSDIIRRMWLRAIAQRAEKPEAVER